MSKAVVPLPVIAVEDPVTRLGRPEAFGISQGGIVYSYQQIASQSALSSTGGLIGTVPQTINFVAPPPSPDIIVDRRVYLAITWIVYPSGSFVMGYPPFANQFDAPRAFPNMQAIQSVSAVINNNTITQQMDPIIALMSYNMSKELQDRDYSGAPSMLDQYPDYVTGGVNGQARNPLTDSSYNSVQIPRGGFPVVYANNVASDQTPGGSSPTYGPGGAQNAMYGSQYYPSATFTSIEPFFLTPFGKIHIISSFHTL